MRLKNQNTDAIVIYWKKRSDDNESMIMKSMRTLEHRENIVVKSFQKVTLRLPDVRFGGPISSNFEGLTNQNKRLDQEPGVKRPNRPQALRLKESIRFGDLISKLSTQNVGRKVWDSRIKTI